MPASSTSTVLARDIKAGDEFNPYSAGMFLGTSLYDDHVLKTENGIVASVHFSNNRVMVYFTNLSNRWMGMEDTEVPLSPSAAN